MVVAIARRRGYSRAMPEQRIAELELQLLAANDTILKLTQSNAQLTSSLADAEVRNRKIRKSARRDESSFKEQLAAANSRRS